MGDEGALKLAQRAVPRCQPFDRQHILPFHLPHGDETAVHDFAVDHHRARAALPFAAPFLGPGLAQVLAQHVEQPAGSLSLDADSCTVQYESSDHAFVRLSTPSNAVKIFSGVAGISSSQTPVAS